MLERHGRNHSPRSEEHTSELQSLHDALPISQGKAVTLSEGKLVILDAFVFDAKHDDSFPFGFGGEGVNCKNSLLEWNDIHVALVDTSSAKECSSVTAEIIPQDRKSTRLNSSHYTTLFRSHRAKQSR